MGELIALGPAEWPTIRTLGRPVTYEPGEVIFGEGDRSRSVYAVREGTVKITVLTPSGRELLLGLKEANDLLGELAAIDGQPRSATATALGDLSVVVLEGDAFDRVLDRHPHLARRLLSVLASQLREADWRTADREGGDTLSRVARRVCILSERYGEYSGGGVQISLRLTQEDLAAWVGATREATSRSLSVLREAGAVETGRRRLVVVDVDVLRSFVR